jgi:acyl carrier protein
MERSDVLEAMRELGSELLSVEPGQITEDAKFGDDLEADSLDLTELVMALEDRFDIEVAEDDLEDVRTVGQAVDVVLASLAARSSQ